jgi:hypothetical protein
MAQVDMNWPGVLGNYIRQGVFMRYVSTTQYAVAMLDSVSPTPKINFQIVYPGQPSPGFWATTDPGIELQAGITVFYTLRMAVAASGEWQIWFYETGSPSAAPLLAGQDDALATGGGLETGKVGLYDRNSTVTPTSRLYDSFRADSLVEGTFGLQGLDFELVPIEFSGGKIATLNVSAALGADKPNAIFENPATAPVYGTDYVVGDTVRMRAKYNGVTRLNGTVRVYGIELVIDDEGKETVVPTLIAE